MDSETAADVPDFYGAGNAFQRRCGGDVVALM